MTWKCFIPPVCVLFSYLVVSLEVQKSVARAHDIVSKEFLPDPRHEDLYLCFPLRVSQFQLLHLGLSPLLVHFCVWRQAGIGCTWGSSFPDVVWVDRTGSGRGAAGPPRPPCPRGPVRRAFGFRRQLSGTTRWQGRAFRGPATRPHLKSAPPQTAHQLWPCPPPFPPSSFPTHA